MSAYFANIFFAVKQQNDASFTCCGWKTNVSQHCIYFKTRWECQTPKNFNSLKVDPKRIVELQNSVQCKCETNVILQMKQKSRKVFTKVEK